MVEPKRSGGSTRARWVRHFLLGVSGHRMTVANVQYGQEWDSSIVEAIHGHYDTLMLLQVDETGAWVWSRVGVTHQVLLSAI